MSKARNKPGSRVTLKSIAERVGVSYSTVSFVVNGRSDEFKISHDTRKRVLDAARDLDYKPDSAARALKGQRTRSIGVLWSLSGYNPIIEMVNGLAFMAKRHGYASYLTDHFNDPAETLAALEDYLSRRVDAVVMDADPLLLKTEPILKALSNFAAVVAISNEPVDVPFDLVVHRRGPLYEQAARHLLARGRRRLAVALADLRNHEPKIEAVRKVLSEEGHDPASLVTIRFHCDFPGVQPSLGQDRLLNELETRFPGDVSFDALLCASDEDAAFCIAWLNKKGLKVPEDVAITGLNDTPWGRITVPPLATGLRHNEQVAEAVEQMLFDRLADSSLSPQRATVDMEFVWRESAG
jgi:LacI family transcriptional regulator